VLSFDNIPTCMKEATISSRIKLLHQSWHRPERHPAALWIDLRGGERWPEAVPSPQQVARTLLLNQNERYERSLRRKLREPSCLELTQKFQRTTFWPCTSTRSTMEAWPTAWKPRQRLTSANPPAI